MVSVLPAAAALRAPFAALAHFGVERGEEQVLQDGAVVIAFVRRLRGIRLEQWAHVFEPEQAFRDQAAFLDEPAEDDAG